MTLRILIPFMTRWAFATVDLEKSIQAILACGDILGLESSGHVPKICYETLFGFTPDADSGLRRGRRHHVLLSPQSKAEMCSSKCKRYPRLLMIDVKIFVKKMLLK